MRTGVTAVFPRGRTGLEGVFAAWFTLNGNGEMTGDIFLAFSTANRVAPSDTGLATVTMLPNDRINPIFEATVQATEEAIVNAMLAAETMTGADRIRSSALPHGRLREVMRKYGRAADESP